MTVFEVECYKPTAGALFTLTVLAPDAETASEMALAHLDLDGLVSGTVRPVAEPGDARLLIITDGKVTGLVSGTEPRVLAHRSGTRSLR